MDELVLKLNTVEALADVLRYAPNPGEFLEECLQEAHERIGEPIDGELRGGFPLPVNPVNKP